jgi:multiple sugar transport system substrate-binding protein
VPPFRGLTWDHPRGYDALAAAAGTLLHWDRQPLEGFESHPIADLCARYDIVVLDHPHIGEAVAADCLLPVEAFFAADEIAAWQAATVGSCLASYRYASRHWALPLDAACQVMATRPDRLAGPPPTTWEAVIALSAGAAVALSLAGPHALISLFSIATALGEAPASRDPERLLSTATATDALEILSILYRRMPEEAKPLNPIGLLDLMASTDTVALCPLVFGYVPYAAPKSPAAHAVAFHDAPSAAPGGPPGTTLGGTGLAISRRCTPSPALLDHLRWLLSPATQRGFIVAHSGQPSRREAWTDAAVNWRWGDFYRNTQASIEAAWVRPRYPGYIAFQTLASAALREALASRTPPAAIIAGLQDLYVRSRPPAAEL